MKIIEMKDLEGFRVELTPWVDVPVMLTCARCSRRVLPVDGRTLVEVIEWASRHAEGCPR